MILPKFFYYVSSAMVTGEGSMKPLIGLVGSLALVVAACSPKPGLAPAPTQAAADTFKGCTWKEVRGKTLSIWAFACGPDSSSIHLLADDNLPGFALVSGNGNDGGSYTPVIRTFAKDSNAPIEAVLPQVRKISPGPQTTACAFEPAQDPLNPDYSKRKLYQLAPTGAAKVAWDQTIKTGEGDATPPCGAMGVAMDGDRVFEVMPDDPGHVVYIDYGSEIQVFDTNTLKTLK